MHAYAGAILPRQIAKRLKTPDAYIDNLIAEERKWFSFFCEMKAQDGIFYSSQLEAWINYNEQYPPNIEDENEVEPPLMWEREIKEAFERSVMPSNYTETMGQQ